MKRYFVQMFSNNKFMMNFDFDTLEASIANLNGYIDKLIIKDMETEIEYVVIYKRINV
jgi:hypothetical protein